jgi:16S rRNA (uracil1498-N3)-methyltransferase
MTSSIRLYVPDPLHAGAEPRASPAQAHYLGAVMRRSAGEAVVLFNGVDGEWLASIAAIRRDQAIFTLTRQIRPQTAGADLWLVFAALKRDATDLVVQKATELGVAALLPVTTARTNTARLNEARLLAIATEAAEQCERLTLPRIAALRSLSDVLADWPAERTLTAAIERSDAATLTPAPGPGALLVGPEGGFTPAELDALRGHPFVVPATLGPLVLRAETAAIVGLALLQAPTGRAS